MTFRKFFFSGAVNALDFVNIASRKYDNFFGMRAERFSRVRSLDKDNILHVHCFLANIVQSLGQRKRSRILIHFCTSKTVIVDDSWVVVSYHLQNLSTCSLLSESFVC